MADLNRVIVISGASNGIGLAIATQLGKMGNTVFAGARKEGDIEKLSSVKNVHGVQLDITKQEDIQVLAHHIELTIGHVDVLINNAGIPGWGAIMDREIDYFRRIMDVNLFGHIQMVQAFYPLLRKSTSSPIIVNMSSQGGNYALPFWSPYHMSKWALEAFSDCLRRELLPFGIRVAVIQPGAIASNAFSNQQEEFTKYKEEKKSDFSHRTVKFLQAAFSRDPGKEKDPQVVVDTILHAVYNENNKPYYHPGRRLIPDIIAAKLPSKWIDKLLLKI